MDLQPLNVFAHFLGQFHYNLKQGIGTRRYIDGSKYRGNFEGNKINGHGTMHYCAEDPGQLKKYTGEWKDGRFHGTGELEFTNSCEIRSYQGEFYQGLFHQGKITYRDGGYYEGQFNAKNQLLGSFPCYGLKHGQGTRVFASGNKFEGTFADDFFVEGKYTTYSDSKYCSTYVGKFKKNKKYVISRSYFNHFSNIFYSKIFMDLFIIVNLP